MSGSSFSLDLSLISFHDTPTDSESQPGSGIFILVQPLEQSKYLLREPGFKADAVIAEWDDPVSIFALGRDLDLGRDVAANIFFRELESKLWKSCANWDVSP